jgi:hypothetical protein
VQVDLQLELAARDLLQARAGEVDATAGVDRVGMLSRVAGLRRAVRADGGEQQHDRGGRRERGARRAAAAPHPVRQCHVRAKVAVEAAPRAPPAGDRLTRTPGNAYNALMDAELAQTARPR